VIGNIISKITDYISGNIFGNFQKYPIVSGNYAKLSERFPVILPIIFPITLLITLSVITGRVIGRITGKITGNYQCRHR